jgi:hypothetical protein
MQPQRTARSESESKEKMFVLQALRFRCKLDVDNNVDNLYFWGGEGGLCLTSTFQKQG